MYFSIPHRAKRCHGASCVLLRPGAYGTGVVAGGAPRIVLEIANIRNVFGKQLRSPNLLNNARATLDCFEVFF